MKYPREKLFFVCTGERCNNPDRGEMGDAERREDLELREEEIKSPVIPSAAEREESGG